mmetsp:Transcript_2232/g.7278  ORF Transcript_2232/g.7278 Transcript_2232/m.7278 type:complete len:257 (-) Transcript_2232:213-983(-)
MRRAGAGAGGVYLLQSMPPILRLRPATAAGRLLQFFASKLPFGAAPPPRLFGARASAGEGRLHLDDRVFYARPLELVHDPVWMQKGERRVQELPLVREGAELRDVAAEVHEGGGANAEEQRLPALAGVPRRDVEFGRGGAASELCSPEQEEALGHAHVAHAAPQDGLLLVAIGRVGTAHHPHQRRHARQPPHLPQRPHHAGRGAPTVGVLPAARRGGQRGARAAGRVPLRGRHLHRRHLRRHLGPAPAAGVGPPSV